MSLQLKAKRGLEFHVEEKNDVNWDDSSILGYDMIIELDKEEY
jgi:hypothetical protein